MNAMHGIVSLGTRYARLPFVAMALLGMTFAGSAAAASPPAQSLPKAETAKVTTVPAGNPKTEQELNAVQQAWVNAEIHRDAATLRRILSPRFIFTFGVGAPESRDRFIHAIVTAPDTKQTQTLSETRVVTDGDTAIVAGLDTVQGVVHGKPYKAEYRYMVTYVRRNGHWVALAEHLAPVPNQN